MAPKKPGKIPEPIHPPPPGLLLGPDSGSPIQVDTPSPVPTPGEIRSNLRRAHDAPVDWADMQNRVVHGRPQVPWSWTQWPMRPQQTHGMPETSAVFVLHNGSSFCYRNTVLQLLLNSRIFYNWVRKHCENSIWPCARAPGSRRDCLVCSFAALAAQYLERHPQDNNAAAIPNHLLDSGEGIRARFEEQNVNVTKGMVEPLLVQRTDEFFFMCERVFWGPRAQRRNKIGPIDMNRGSHHWVFLGWLLHYFREQVSHRPSEVQSFDLIFGGHGSKSSTCNNSKCEFNRPRKNIKYPELARKDVTFNYILPRAIPFKGGSIQDLPDDHFAKDFSQSVPCPLCTEYGRKGIVRFRVVHIHPPEVLLVNYDRQNLNSHMTPEKTYRTIPITEDVTIPTVNKGRAHYRLRGTVLCQFQRPRNDLGDGHLYAFVESRNGDWYLCDDSTTTISSLAEYNAYQAESTAPPH